MLAWLAAQPWALRLAKWGAMAVAAASALLFALKRAEKAGAAAERLKAQEQVAKTAKRRMQNETSMRGATDADLDRWLRPPGRRQ